MTMPREMPHDLRWLTVAVPESAGDPATRLHDALDEVALAPSDVVHLKLWTASVAAADDVAGAWRDLFPDRDHRPCISVIPSLLADGIDLVITVVAVPGGAVRSIYEPHQSDHSFPSAAVSGDHFFVSGLTAVNVEADAKGQAEEVFTRLGALVAQAGAKTSGIGHMFVWYQDHSVRDVINEPFLQMFTTPGDRPARHSVVRQLPSGAALMIEVAGSVDPVRSCYGIGGLWHGGIGGVPNSLPFGTRCGDVLFSAGTYGRDPGDGEIPDSLTEQTRWALHFSHEFLRVAGMTPADVGQIYVWVRNAEDVDDAFKSVESAFATDGSPVSIQVIQAALPGTNQIQIELVAQRSTAEAKVT